MANSYSAKHTYYCGHGAKVYKLFTGTEQPTIRPQRNHKRVRGNSGFDPTRFYEGNER